MQSIRELYRIGNGPSSSHTMGPKKAAEMYQEKHPQAPGYRVTLFGSLAATGKGHMTDEAIIQALSPKPVDIVWQPDEELPGHPNGMRFEALDEHGNPGSSGRYTASAAVRCKSKARNAINSTFIHSTA